MADLICSTEELPSYVPLECGGDNAGIVAVGFLDDSVDFDGSPNEIESEAAWEALLAASPQLVQIIKDTRGEYPKPAVVETEGFGRVSTIATGRDHEVTFEVPGIKENVNFFKIANRRRDLKFVFVTNGGLLHYVNTKVRVDAAPVIDRDINGWEVWSVSVKWSNYDFPDVYDEPGDIFK